MCLDVLSKLPTNLLLIIFSVHASSFTWTLLQYPFFWGITWFFGVWNAVFNRNLLLQKLLCRYELRNRNSLVPWAHQSWSEVTFLRYTKEQRFKKHIDHVSSIFDGERKGIPILTIIGWLNNNFEGRNTHLQYSRLV